MLKQKTPRSPRDLTHHAHRWTCVIPHRVGHLQPRKRHATEPMIKGWTASSIIWQSEQLEVCCLWQVIGLALERGERLLGLDRCLVQSRPPAPGFRCVLERCRASVKQYSPSIRPMYTRALLELGTADDSPL